MTESDAELVARALTGHAAAYEALLVRHFRAAFLVAVAIVSEPADAEDVCQDAFVRAWERLRECRDGTRFRAWLCQIVRNLAINHTQRSPSRRMVSLHDADARALGGDSPAHLAERAELAEQLRHALEKLPLVQRQIVLLHDLEGLRHSDIASTLGISVAMSRRHLSDARRVLRQLLGSYVTVEPDHD